MDLTEEQTVLLNCVLYDPTLDGFEGLTLWEWAKRILARKSWYPSNIPPEQQYGVDGNQRSGGMTFEEMQNVAKTILADPALYSLRIANVTPRPTTSNKDGWHPVPNNATFTAPGTIIVAYMGTGGGDEWYDNGQGGYSGTTDTPDQKNALIYFNQMMALYGQGCPTVITTGHSKGGNLATYVAILSGGVVTHSYNVDGQGFSYEFMLKYRDLIDQALRDGVLTTYACAMDFVNILFAAIMGQTFYTQAPDPPPDDVTLYHSPYSMLEVGPDGKLHLRPPAEQDPAITAADSFIDYVQKFMSPDNFQLLCQMAVGLAGGELSIDDIFHPPSNWVEIIAKLIGAGVSSSIEVLQLVASWFDEPYDGLIIELCTLLEAFLSVGGIGPDAEDGLKTLLKQLFPGMAKLVDPIWWIVTKTLKDDGAPVPYSAIARDYSQSVYDELIKLVDAVVPVNPPTNNPAVVDGFKPQLGQDEEDREQYYWLCIKLGQVTRQQIDRIFTDVREEDSLHASSMSPLTQGMETTLLNLKLFLSGFGG